MRRQLSCNSLSPPPSQCPTVGISKAVVSAVLSVGKEMFNIITHSTYFIYGYDEELTITNPLLPEMEKNVAGFLQDYKSKYESGYRYFSLIVWFLR